MAKPKRESRRRESKEDVKDGAMAASEKINEVKQEERHNHDKGIGAPNQGNDLDLDKYSQVQSLQEATVNIPMPPRTKSRFISCKIKKNHHKVGLKNRPPIINGELDHPIKVGILLELR